MYKSVLEVNIGYHSAYIGNSIIQIRNSHTLCSMLSMKKAPSKITSSRAAKSGHTKKRVSFFEHMCTSNFRYLKFKNGNL